jgi:hypothetical protein
MKCNVGPIDRLIRIIAGLIIAIIGVVFESWWGLVGIIFLATGLFKFCLFYIPFNISTAREKEQ